MRATRLTVLVVAAAMLVAGRGGGSSTHVISSSPHPAPSASLPGPPPSAAVLAARLKAAGLPVRRLIIFTASTDPNHLLGRQGGYTSKVEWKTRVR